MHKNATTINAKNLNNTATMPACHSERERKKYPNSSKQITTRNTSVVKTNTKPSYTNSIALAGCNTRNTQ